MKHLKFIRGYRINYCHRHEIFNQGYKKYCFICGTDLYKTRISKRMKTSIKPVIIN